MGPPRSRVSYGFMGWEELSLEIPRARLEAVSAALFAAGSAGVQELDDAPPRQIWDRGPAPEPSERLTLKAWFEDPDRGAVSAALRAAAGEVSLSWSGLADRDWEAEWRARFVPIRISERLTIAPPAFPIGTGAFRRSQSGYAASSSAL